MNPCANSATRQRAIFSLLQSGLLGLALLCLPLAASAQIFVCKDANGRTLTSDRPIPECAKQPMRELNTNGVVTRQIPAPLTEEQKRARDAEEEKQRAAQALINEQKRTDRALLLRYRNEADIEAARKRNVSVVQEQIRRETNSLNEYRAQLKATQAQAAANQQKNLPLAMRRTLEESQRGIETSEALIKQREQELGQLNTNYDASLKRFRELNAADAPAPDKR